MMKTENTVLQMIAGAARCPEYGPDMVKALMEKLDMNERAFALLMKRGPFHHPALDQRRGTAQRHGQAAHADLRGRAGDRGEDCRGAFRRGEGFLNGRHGTDGGGAGTAHCRKWAGAGAPCPAERKQSGRLSGIFKTDRIRVTHGEPPCRGCGGTYQWKHIFCFRAWGGKGHGRIWKYRGRNKVLTEY